MDDTARAPSGPSHWEDLKPRGILKTDQKLAEKRETANRVLLDRQRNEITLKILVLGAPRTGKSSFIRSFVQAAQSSPGQPPMRSTISQPAPTLGIETTTLLAVALDSTPVFWRLVEASDSFMKTAPAAHLRILFSGVHAAFVLFNAGDSSVAMASLNGADYCRDELQRRIVSRLPRAVLDAAGGAPPPLYLVAYCADGLVGAAVRRGTGGPVVDFVSGPGYVATHNANRRLMAADAYAASADGRRGVGRWGAVDASLGGGEATTSAGGSSFPLLGAGADSVSTSTGSSSARPPNGPTTSGRRPPLPAAVASRGKGAGQDASPPTQGAAKGAESVDSGGLPVPEYCYGLSAADLATFAAAAGYRQLAFLCSPWLAKGYSGVVGDGSSAGALSNVQQHVPPASAFVTDAAALDGLRAAPPAALGSERHRLTSVAAAERFKAMLASVSEDALAYWGFLLGSDAAADSTQQRWYVWRSPWPGAVTPVAAD